MGIGVGVGNMRIRVDREWISEMSAMNIRWRSIRNLVARGGVMFNLDRTFIIRMGIATVTRW